MLERIGREQAECWFSALLVTALVLAGLALKGAPPADPQVAAQIVVRVAIDAAGMFAGASACADGGLCLRI